MPLASKASQWSGAELQWLRVGGLGQSYSGYMSVVWGRATVATCQWSGAELPWLHVSGLGQSYNGYMLVVWGRATAATYMHRCECWSLLAGVGYLIILLLCILSCHLDAARFEHFLGKGETTYWRHISSI